MPLQLTPAVQSQFPLLAGLTKFLPQFQDIKETQGDGLAMYNFLENTLQGTVLPALDSQAVLEDFDNKVVRPLPQLFMNQQANPLTNMAEFFGLQSFLFQLRKKILILENQPVPEPVLTKHQERIISPSKKAYELMGNNLLNIKESPNSYGLIFE